MRLSDAAPGSFVFIEVLPAGDISAQAIRLGLYPGARLLCLSAIPGGPVVVRAGLQEIAVGRRLACRIFVTAWGKGSGRRI